MLFEIANALKMDIFQLGILFIFVLLMALFAIGINAIRRTEIYKQNEHIIKELNALLADYIIMAALGRFDVDAWKAEEKRREEVGLPHIDYRMLFVLDKAENWLEQRGIDMELEDLYARAERIYKDINAN